jgi:inorganic pyrophosphatase
MPNLTSIPIRDASGHLRVVVETPRGSNVKLAYDPALECFVLRRALTLGVTYPFDWGFVPSTRAEDGDPLDAMVLFDGSTYPGVVLACRVLGVVKVSEKGGRRRNDRIIAVPVDFARLAHVQTARDLPKRTLDEIAAFFVLAVTLAKDVKVLGWAGPAQAEALITKSAKQFGAGSS